MSLRSVNLFSNSQRLFGSVSSTGANLNGGWTATATTAQATTTLTIASANNGTYSSTADKTFTVTVSGETYTFIANANFTVSGGSASVAVTSVSSSIRCNDVANGGNIPNSSTFTGTSAVLGSGTATAGAISGGQGSPGVAMVPNTGAYFQYIPLDDVSSIGNLLILKTDGTNDVTILSPTVALSDQESLLSSVLVFSGTDNLAVTSTIQFFETIGGSAIADSNTAQLTNVTKDDRNMVFNAATVPDGAAYVRLKLVISKDGGSLSNLSLIGIFDPVIADFTPNNTGTIASLVYNDLPNFMLLDDQHIRDIVKSVLGNKTQGKLTLASCTNATYPAGTEFTVAVDSKTYTYLAVQDFTVSSGSATVDVVSKYIGKIFNDVTHGGIIPNGSNQFDFTGKGGGSVTAGTGDTNGLINGTNSESDQLPLPLLNFVSSLVYPIDVMYNSSQDFKYTHATEGTLSRSTLTDPRTSPASYLPWISTVTGSTLLSSASGFTPWTALEEYDGDSGGDPGEWEDFEVLSNWNALEDVNPDFFDELQSHRDQLTTGFTGILSGKIETMENFLDTVVDTDTPSNFTVRVTNDKFNNPFRIQSLVDPAVDPDVGGTLIKDALDAGAPAGAIAASTNNVIESGDGSYDFSGLLVNADGGEGTTAAGTKKTGAQVVPTNFVNDRDGFNRSILFNTGLTGDLGGGIGTSQYTADSSYLLGESGSVVTDRDTGSDDYGTSLNFAGDNTAVDIIVELTNFTPFEASAWTSADTSSGGAPHDSLLREKRLLVCGGDYNGTSTLSKAHDNDWAFYVVSGFGTAADPKMRLLWIDGYVQETGSNYAYSSEIDMSTASQYGPIVFRVSKSASDVVKFYAQSSIYDDWDSNELAATPSTAITPTIDASAGQDAGIQIGGAISNSKWSDASALPAAFKRVMINNAVFTFTGSGSTSSENHAYVDGSGVDDFATVTYSPLVDLDLSGAAKYATDIDTGAKKTVGSTVTNIPLTVNEPTEDVNLLAMEPSDTHNYDASAAKQLWYFGNNDTLAVSGLSSANYDWRVTRVNTSTGALVTADGGGTATSFSFAAGTYGGQSIVSIDVIPDGGTFGSNGVQSAASVAFFTPSTIGAATNPASCTGTDNKSKTWTLTRTFPTVTTAYAPSQLIDKPAVQAYKGAPVIAEAPQIEYYTPFSIAMQVRRHWTASSGTEYNIFSLLNTESTPQGLKIFYVDGKLRATFSDGNFTETVSFTETPFGNWKNVVVQRDPQTGFRLYVNGTLAETATINTSLAPFASPTSVGTFGQGTASQYFARFSLSHFAYYDRFLSTNEISLLNSQLT